MLQEFIALGFKAIIIATQREFLGKEWLGRQIDENFMEEIEKVENMDICGEKGEYHTFVYNGPIFKNPVESTFGKKITKGKYCFLQLIP